MAVSVRRRSSLVAAALVVAATALPAAAGVTTGRTPTLSGKTTIVVTKSAYTTVRVPVAIEVPVALHLTVSDPAHFIATVLVAQALPGSRNVKNATLITTSLPGPNGTWRYVIAGAQFGAGGFRPGLYWLYVLATGPERVTWNLPLPGAARTLRPEVAAEHAATTVTRPTMTTNGTSAPYSNSYGHSLTGGNAEVWSLDLAHGTHMKVAESDACYYDGSDPVADAAEGLPAPVCRGGLQSTNSFNLPDGDAYAVGGVQSSLGSPGSQNLGLKTSVEFAGIIAWAAGRNIWFDLPKK